MITELTEEQKKLIPFYVDKWAKIGLSCGPVKDYEETINLFYEKILNKKRPTEIILAPSPLQVFELMGNQIDQSVWGQVWIRVWVQVENQVRKQVGKHVLEQVWMQVLEQVRKQVWQVYLNDGRLDFRIFPFYDYFNQVLDIQYPDAWSIFKKKEIELGFVYALFDDICILSDRPEQISIKDGVLHNESGMAIKYRDRWGVYMLNGVRVTKEIAETPADLRQGF